MTAWLPVAFGNLGESSPSRLGFYFFRGVKAKATQRRWLCRTYTVRTLLCIISAPLSFFSFFSAPVCQTEMSASGLNFLFFWG